MGFNDWSQRLAVCPVSGHRLHVLYSTGDTILPDINSCDDIKQRVDVHVCLSRNAQMCVQCRFIEYAWRHCAVGITDLFSVERCRWTALVWCWSTSWHVCLVWRRKRSTARLIRSWIKKSSRLTRFGRLPHSAVWRRTHWSIVWEIGFVLCLQILPLFVMEGIDIQAFLVCSSPASSEVKIKPIFSDFADIKCTVFLSCNAARFRLEWTLCQL